MAKNKVKDNPKDHQQVVAAVVVAYNRRELLRETLEALGAQTRTVQKIFVVDNASTDGSTQVAAEMVARLGTGARLIALKENTGGAGGFAVGIAAAAVDPDVSWIWVMDDDTVPHEGALEEALRTHERYRSFAKNDSLAVVGSRVVWKDGLDHPMNTPKEKIGVSAQERNQAEKAGGMAIRSISFVSAFLRAERVRQKGLPVADYFLWNDDFEYSTRLLKGASGIYAPDSVVTHKTKIRGSSDQDPGERFYFEVRNKLWVFLHSSSLKPWEKIAYFGASLRRWSRTFKGSKNRGVLLSCLGRGLRDGLFMRPRKNSLVLSDAGIPEDVRLAISAFESRRER